eukprot:SAG31_NODE_38472_length_296_cov_0.527919_2_plen_28_part_01
MGIGAFALSVAALGNFVNLVHDIRLGHF